MIKYCRQIRQDLLSGGNIGKYFKYAIGEIVLVVVGILIALQINNWNENRKLKNEEFSLLLEVKSNMEATLNSFKNDSVFNHKTILQYEKIKHYIEEDLPYNRELDTAFGMLKSWRSPYPIYTAYTTLKTKGLDVISNASLRNKIVTMNEYEFTRLITDYDKSEWILYQEVVLPFISKHLRIYKENSTTLAKPTDFEILKDNDELRNILELLINERKNGLRSYKKVMLDTKDLIESIENELNSRV